MKGGFNMFMSELEKCVKEFAKKKHISIEEAKDRVWEACGIVMSNGKQKE